MKTKPLAVCADNAIGLSAPSNEVIDLINALNNSAAVHTFGEKDDTKMNPPPDSIPCTLAGELDSDEEASQGAATEEEADTDLDDEANEEQAEDSDSDEQDQQDNEPSTSEAEKEQEKKEQEAKDAARWHDYACAFASNGTFKPEHVAAAAGANASALLDAFKARFPNA